MSASTSAPIPALSESVSLLMKSACSSIRPWAEPKAAAPSMAALMSVSIVLRALTAPASVDTSSPSRPNRPPEASPSAAPTDTMVMSVDEALSIFS